MQIKFRYKLFLSLVFILVFTALMISGLWYSHSKKLITDNMLDTTEILLNERTREINTILKNIDYQSILLSHNNPDVDRNLGDKWKDSYLNAQASKKLNDYIDSIYASNPNIMTIEVGNYHGDVIGRGMLKGSKFIKDRGIYQLLLDHPDELLVIPYSDQDLNIKEIMFIRNVVYYGKTIGYSLISIPSSIFDDSFEGIFPKDAMITIYNSQSELIYTAGKFDPEIVQSSKDVLTGKDVVQDSQQNDWLIINNHVPSVDILINVAVPMDNMLSDIKSRYKDIIYVVLIMMTVLLMVVYLVSKWISRNISYLSNAMKKFSDGDMDSTIVIQSNDEFSILSKTFNNMTSGIKQLLEDIKRNEKEKMDLEIRALQGQINMHFLFNALNTIKNLSYIQRVSNIERLVGALMELLNISMTNGSNYVTLETEITYSQHFLEIYKYKSIKQIDCLIDIEEEIKDAHVLKFMLQPIVENAIIHGIEPIDEDKDGLIVIKAYRVDDDIEIRVTDNGKGFDAEKVSKFNGIGISNTDQRIKVHYGQAYGITIESKPDVSTTVQIRIPYRKDTP